MGPEQALDALERSGASAMVLDREAEPQHWEIEFPVLAVEAPSPKSRASAAMLCSPDREEARTALEAALETAKRAAQKGARFLCLWLGELRSMDKEWRFARDKFIRGDLEDRFVQLLLKQRRAEGERAVDAARRVLDRLARTAEGEGLTVAVANARRFIAVPSAWELDLLMRDLRGAPIAPLFDVPAAHLPDVMGFFPLELTQATFGAAPLVYWGDAFGPICGLVPGQGELDLTQIKTADNAERVFSPWSGLTLEETFAAVSKSRRP
jgi:hypothetical protein